MFSALGTSVIRTVVPFIVSLILVNAAKYLGLDLPEGAVEQIVTVVVGAAYYAAARWLEENVTPKFGKLLGKATSPQYALAA